MFLARLLSGGQIRVATHETTSKLSRKEGGSKYFGLAWIWVKAVWGSFSWYFPSDLTGVLYN